MKTSFMSSALLLGAILFVPATSAQAGPYQECLNSGESRTTCACERALRIGTQSALRQFMRSYDESGTACAATASTAPSGGGVRLVPESDLGFGQYDTSATGNDSISKNPNE